MIDPTRWVLAEAWLALGLRLEAATTRWSFDRYTREQIMDDEELNGRFVYTGLGVWLVQVDDRASGLGFPNPLAPQLGAGAMRHELAHYLVATDDQRREVNFGIDPKDDDAERRALEAEKVIHALATAGGRALASVITGAGRR